MTQPQDATHSEPVLIYCPGLGTAPTNSASGVADVIAAVLDRRTQGTFRAEALPKITAPRGLRLGKTVLDGNGKSLLHVFELDYRPRLDPDAGKVVPAAPPGIVRSAWSAVLGLGWLARVWKRPSKTLREKLQLCYGFFVVCALLLAAIVAIVGGLVTIGAGGLIPKTAQGALGLGTAAVTSAGAIGLWSIARRKLLGVAASVQRLTDYTDAQRDHDTIVMTLDDAIDGLRDNGWTGRIHVLGYSFGSLLAVDSLFPIETRLAPNARLTEAIDSLTTIGCPADVVRLYKLDYFDTRFSRAAPQLKWVNVLNPMDILASNFADESSAAGEGKPLMIAGMTPTTKSYGTESLGFKDILAIKGFRTHDGYWGKPDEASCFDSILSQWFPETARPTNLQPAPQPAPVG